MSTAFNEYSAILILNRKRILNFADNDRERHGFVKKLPINSPAIRGKMSLAKREIFF
jgi:hypothetical protein